MQHIRQRKNECFPTVLAMLSGCSVDKILADAQALGPTVHSWSDFASTSDDKVALVYRSLARKYAPFLVEHCQPVNVLNTARQGLFMPYAKFASAIAQGRGAVLMCSRFISRPLGHIAAYQDGIVYCSEQDGPKTALEYYKLLKEKSPLCPFAVISEY